MKTANSRVKGLFLVAVVAMINVSFSNVKVPILHRTGTGDFEIITVSINALSAHAKHGDLYLTSLCPLTGAEYACREGLPN
jgi:hypothetical protein